MFKEGRVWAGKGAIPPALNECRMEAGRCLKNLLLSHFNGHKLKPGKFHLNMRKNFFTLRVTEPWPRLPREAVESPSLEIFQTCLDKVLCSLL